MTEMNRILTIQVEITDADKAVWIWDNHMRQETNHGVLITAIIDGNLLENIIELDEASDNNHYGKRNDLHCEGTQ